MKEVISFLTLLLLLGDLENAAFTQTNLLDTTFNPGSGAAGGFVESMIIQPDGKILICGNFTSFAGKPRSYIARLEADGSVDTSFSADVGYWVRSMALQFDGKIVIGGFFTTVGGQLRNRIARLNVDGNLDLTFNVGTGCEGRIVSADPTEPFLFAIGIQNDGRIIIGGNFTTYNGIARSGIARLNIDGSLDTTFNPRLGMNSWVRSLLVQSNGQVSACGWFTSYNNQPYNRIVRINSDGTADTSFSAYFGDQTAVYTMARQPDGKIIVVGHTISSAFTQKIVRLNLDGSYDNSFDPGTGASDKVESVVLQPDGKAIIGGYFGIYNGTPVDNLARLNPDGSLDNSFSAQVNDWIWTTLLQNDGRLLICGGFTTVDGVSRRGIARLHTTRPLRLLNPSKEGNVFTTSVSTQAGKSYSLQYKSSFPDTQWTTLSGVIGDGTVKILADTNAIVSRRFYHVIQN